MSDDLIANIDHRSDFALFDKPDDELQAFRAWSCCQEAHLSIPEGHERTNIMVLSI